MHKKDDQDKASKIDVLRKDSIANRLKKSAAERVLLDQDQSQTVVKLVRKRLKKLAKKSGAGRKGKEVKRLRKVASVLGTNFRLKWSKDKEKYVVAAHVARLS
jgi:hypothetical protein